jgi:alcohol dehydrogenase (cytochrome c)
VGVDQPSRSGVKALDPETGKTMWTFDLYNGSLSAGLLATGGGVVFVASPDGNLVALDSGNGKYLWRFGTGARMAASPISYSIDGRQYITVASTGALHTFALPEPRR